MSGILYLVSSPIGNLGDMSARGAAVFGRGRSGGRRGYAAQRPIIAVFGYKKTFDQLF